MNDYIMLAITLAGSIIIFGANFPNEVCYPFKKPLHNWLLFTTIFSIFILWWGVMYET